MKKKTKDAREQTQRAEAKDDVDLAVANMQIEAMQKTMTQEEKRQSIENELKKIRNESTVTISGDGFKANHKGYEFEISDTGEISLKGPFEASEWDKTAAPEDVFIWQSDDPTSPDYGKVVGYKKNLDNYPILRYPSRCTSVGVDSSYITGTWEEKDTIRSYTKNIKKVELPETVTKIDSAFGGGNIGYHFTEMIEINIPDGVVTIGDDTFFDCTSLSSITIPDSVTSIGSSAFKECSSLSSVTIPDSVTSIGYSAFQGCTSLSSITIPDRVADIGNLAFAGCTNLGSVTIPDSVTSIGYSAFFGCRSLNSITIPGSVTSIGSSAFEYVPHIEYHGTATGSPWGANSIN